MLPPLTLSAWLRYSVLRARIDRLPIASVLEIGPGAGALGARLARRYDYVGVEIDPVSAELAKERLARVGRGTVVNGVPDDLGGTFDLVCAFEVLEHIEDDAAELARWRERVSPGGRLAISVPAGAARWGAHDVKAGHFRRYERAPLERLLADAGFAGISIASYGFPLLTALVPVWNALSARAPAGEAIDVRTKESGRFRQPPELLAPLTQAAAAPFALLQRPFLGTDRGSGYLALALRS